MSGDLPEPTGDPGELGFEAALERVQRIERALGVSIELSAAGKRDDSPLALAGSLKNYTGIVNELRQCEKGLMELQVARAELVPKADLVETMCALAAMLRGAVSRLAERLTPTVTARLGTAGVTISDLTLFQQVFHGAVQEATDVFLDDLSREVAKEGTLGDEP